MQKTSFNLKIFMGKCKTYIPKYFISLRESINSKQDITLAKKVILSFLKEYFRHNNNKFYRTRFNVNFINKFLLELVPTQYPELSTIPLFSIQSVITNFINYLTLQNALNRNIQKEIINSLKSQTNFEKELDTKEMNSSPSITNFGSLNREEIIEISNKIIEYSLSLNEISEDEIRFNHVISYFKKKSNKIIIKAILELFKTVEDSLFLKILFFIDIFLKIDTFPSKIIKILKKSLRQNDFYFRLLMLYQTFFLSGYIIEKSFLQLINELKVEKIFFFRYAANIMIYCDNEKFSDFFNHSNNRLELDKLIDFESHIKDIVPIDTNTAYVDINNYNLFNFPKNIDFKLREQTNFLKTIADSFHKKIRFINFEWGEFENYFSKNDEKELIKEAQRLYYDGKIKKALFLTNNLLKKNPDSAVTLYFKGKLLGGQGNHYNALKFHLKSLEVDPYKIETYMDISYLLEIGGYFHSSIILTSLLLRFCPFDFNLHMQLAISSNQLSIPFKKYLKLAGILDAGRLVNFLTHYWVHERIKPRDSLKHIGLTREKFNKLFKSTDLIVLNAIKVMESYGCRIRDENFVNHLKDILRNSLHFFPYKEDHIMKNWFVFELTTRLVKNFHMIFYEDKYNLPYLIASEDFINLCFEISKKTANQILYTLKKNKKQTSFEINDDVLLENKNLVNNPIYNLARFFISDDGLFNTLFKTALNLIKECDICPNHCLDRPYRWCNAFYMLAKVPDELLDYSGLIHFIDCLKDDFELFLEDKDLRRETVNKKVEHIETFLTYLITIVKKKDYNIISQNLKQYIKLENLTKFLGNYIIKNKIISTQTAMKEMCRSLKSFFSFLYNDYRYFDKSTFKDLNKVLNSANFFIKCLLIYQKCFIGKEVQVKKLKEWDNQFLECINKQVLKKDGG